MADTIAYIGRDLEDAIELGLLERSEIPPACSEALGRTNGTIVYTLVSDLVASSIHVRDAVNPGGSHDYIGFSKGTAEALLELKRFNYDKIYTSAAFKPDFVKIRRCYEQLFEYLYEQAGHASGEVRRDLIGDMGREYMASRESAGIVRDYIAGMTDKFFLSKAREIGCDVPERICLPS